METIRTIRISASEIKKDKQSFIACSANIGGKWYKIKFTQDCNDSPRAKGLYDLTIDFDGCSIEKGKKFVSSKGNKGVSNDTIWVKYITKIRKLTDEEIAVINREQLSEIFGK